VAAERTRRIEIEEFVALDDIDPIHWESTYYLAPDKTAAKPYALLLAALEGTSRVGLGRVVLRSKEYLAAIRPARDALMLSTMLFADEIVPRAAVEELGADPAEVSPKELAIASQLVESLAAEWDPDRYKDTYRERVIDLVRAKAEGREIVESHVPEPAAKVDDLMAALEASLAAATSQATARKAPPAKKAGAKPRRAAAPKKS
jgi:DNA end-binding protein Ku